VRRIISGTVHVLIGLAVVNLSIAHLLHSDCEHVHQAGYNEVLHIDNDCPACELTHTFATPVHFELPSNGIEIAVCASKVYTQPLEFGGYSLHFSRGPPSI
jgi:hypothetical protein